jgi:putative hydrolase
MSFEPSPFGDSLPPEFVSFLRSLLGENADAAIESFQASGIDASKMLTEAGLDDNPELLNFLAEQMRRMFSEPAQGHELVNWDFAYDLARKASLEGRADPVVSAAQARTVADAVGVANLWLDEATDFARPSGPVEALSSAAWVEQTMPQWKTITTPIAVAVTDGLSTLLERRQADAPDEMRETLEDAGNMLRGIGGTLFGMQIGHAVGSLSRTVFGFTDTGLPLGPPGGVALVPTVIYEFTEGLDLPKDEILLFLAARECAHARLFAAVPWLGDHLLGAVETYARGIDIDLESLEEAVRDIDMSQPESLRDALSGGVFDIEPSPSQKAALRRLETALALVEGWVEEVTTKALHLNLPDVAALREMMRRRRAAGGPGERTFASLVGLELRPRRAREAARLWAAVEDQGGPAERDALWAHPDLLPVEADLNAPDGFMQRRAAQARADADVDAAIAALLDDADGEESDPKAP